MQHLNDPAYPLYDSHWEHDACGTGFVAQISGEISHQLVQTALEALTRLTHRGAQDADAETSDGAGLLTQIPRAIFCAEIQARGFTINDPEDIAVGMLFLPSEERLPAENLQSRFIIEQTLSEIGLSWRNGFTTFWRDPPIDYAVLGTRARETAPSIAQVLLMRPAHLSIKQYERKLYHARRLIEQRLQEAAIRDCYIASLSRTTIVYKGLLAPNELAHFYLDLADPRYASAFAIFHQRYSTNTFPSWSLAQPFRLLAHNGEINTIQGNRNWMQAREASMVSQQWGDDFHDLLPIIQSRGSDSAQLDNMLELLTLAERDLLHSMQMLIPPAWEHNPELTSFQRAWCEYHAGMMEPWDGPAALSFSDGRFVGAALDRNGLRPARYTLTSHGLLILASEAGVVPCDAHDVVEQGRLGPGEMIAVDLEHGVLLRNAEIKKGLAQRKPYQEWLDTNLVRLTDIHQHSVHFTNDLLDADTLFYLQQLFGYTHEDVELVLRSMLSENKEPIWSMGDDTPMAVLSGHSRSLSDYFHQRFAQVTNPPIDPLREQIVLSLDCYLGRRRNLLAETPLHARLLHLESPLLTESQLTTLRTLKSFVSQTLRTTFQSESGTEALESALSTLELEAVSAVAGGVHLLVLSDVSADLNQIPIPMLLAVGSVHRALIKDGLRTQVSLLCETHSALDVHQIALLLGYGAEAVAPLLALESVRSLAGERHLETLTQEQAVERYLHVIEEGLHKILARMGISTIRNSIGGGQFEILGLHSDVIRRCFAGSDVVAAHPGKVDFKYIAGQMIERVNRMKLQSSQIVHEAKAAPSEQKSVVTEINRRRKLTDMGRFRFRRDGEYHAYNPFIIRALQKAAQSGEMADYKEFTKLVYQRPPTTLRDLVTFTPTNSIPLEQVESMEAIRARFVVSAMSIGALSPETHRTIAAAMNSIGGRNNTGEGGEDPAWYHEQINGYPVSSKIKQVASARFGVTTEYLVRAEELEIKMAQGSKPGEGGQLPPAKVTPFIARLRHTAPHVPLISPPPHHDIYSIEDLAQLIYDLKQVNPKARVGVKLVSSIGVGTIAAGVAKAHADYVLISGHDGGTGASPMQSIKHTGIPWECGLAETQQVLVRNGLRSRVRLRVDGGLKTGRDVVIAAMLGAEEFGFGTASLVALGCDMARQCHLNTCPTGIATQREDLRAKFSGSPHMLIHYLTLVAVETRELMAQLGVSCLDDLVGRADLLRSAEETTIDLESMLIAAPQRFAIAQSPLPQSPLPQSPLPQSPISEQLLVDSEAALRGEHSVLIQHPISNYERSIGASLAGEIARRYGNSGLPGVSITCQFQGAAGQSFGAFNMPGMNLILHGVANDYVGKSMTGGQIILTPPPMASFSAHKNTILGNTVLYGATGGQLFAAGCAGERFAVRNSGALAVVEGVGAHACEYMTGGIVVVLGDTGQNFGAGMSAGVAYVLDLAGVFPRRCNTDLVELQRIDDQEEIDALRTIIQWHGKKTRSWRAAQILAEWSRMQRVFWRVLPRELNVNSQNTSRTAYDYVDAHSYSAELLYK